jgi:hypothetical protein
MRKNINVYRDANLIGPYSFDNEAMSADCAVSIIDFTWRLCGGDVSMFHDLLCKHSIKPVYSVRSMGVTSMTRSYSDQLHSMAKPYTVYIDERDERVPVFIGFGAVCSEVAGDVFYWVSDDAELDRLSMPGNGLGFHIVESL